VKKVLDVTSLAYLAALFSLVTVAAPTHAFAGSPAYMALVVKSPKPSYNATLGTLEQALNQAPAGSWTERGLYARTAKRLHIRDAFNTKAAKRIGHELGLTEVLLVTIRNTTEDGDTKTFADIEVVDVVRGTVTLKRSYFLPDHRMSDGTAAYVADFLTMRQGGVDGDVAEAQDQQGERPASPVFSEMRGRDLDDLPASTPTPASDKPHAAKHHKKSPVAFLNGIL